MAGTTRIPTYPAALAYEAAWNYPPLQSSPPPWWTDITSRVLGPWSTTHGEQYQLARTEAGEWHPVLDNRDGGLDPANTAGPYYPQVAPYKGARIRTQFNPNLLTVDQATAGEQSGLLNAIPPRLNVVNDYGYPLSITASASAYQGTQVYQAVLPSGANQYNTILIVKGAPVVPRQPYSFQAQVRITSGNSVSTHAAILWYDANGNALGSTGGTAQTITSGNAAWTTVSASTSMAPAGAYSAQLKLEIASGSLSTSTTWQVDGLQWERCPYASPWQQPGTLAANLLRQAIATGCQTIDPTVDSAANYFASAAGAIALSIPTYTAPNGAAGGVAWTTPAGTTSSTPLYAGVVSTGAVDGPVADCVQVAAGTQYTASMYVLALGTADLLQITPGIRWYDATGTVISASNGTATAVPTGSTWSRATVTATAPVGAVWGRPRFYISSPASTTVSNTIFSTGWQMEAAASASTWLDPGPTLFAWAGQWEQFPQTWRLSETWGQSDAVATDVLAGLARYTIGEPFIEELSLLSPRFVYQLADPAGSSSVVDSTGTCPAATVSTSPAGVGALTLGAGIQSTTASLAFKGTAGPVATFANTPSAATSSPLTYVALPAAVTTPNYGLSSGIGPGSSSFTRILAFRVSAAPAAAMYLWSATMPTSAAAIPAQLAFWIDTSGHVNLTVTGSATYTQTYSSQSYADGNWHLATIGVENSAGGPTFSLDGATTVVSPSSGSGMPYAMTQDTIGAYVQDAGVYKGGAAADIALAAQVQSLLTSSQITTLYQSWRNASSGESSGARVARLLSWIGYPGATAIDSGQTTSMGPASDLAGSSGLDALNSIIATENGDAYASNSGVLTFKSRAARYNSSPMFIFGEGSPVGEPGEWPVEAVALPTDPVNVYNVIPTQQYSTGQLATAQDVASQLANWPRVLPTRTINSTSYDEVQSAGQYLLGQLKDPRMRLASMTLNVSAVPGLWRVACQLEKGTRIRVMKRPPYRSTTIQCDAFVERTEWSLNPRTGAASLRVEASPADTESYWVLAALHTTVHTQTTVGADTAVINALPDSAHNPLAASLPQGYQLTFDPGTVIAETLTIAPGGIPATNPGYSSATLTFTGTFQYIHEPGATVCEPLPSGYTDPTTWDGASVLGASSTTVISGGAAGSNTITVGQLADYATNPLGSTWNVGDLLWISPGQPSFEGYNLCSPNQATAGEGVLPLAAGSSGASVGITADLGTPTVTASASAYQGVNVWQTSVGASVSTPGGLLYVLKRPATQGQPFAGSAYTRSATSGANPTVYLYVKFLDATGASLAQFNSGNTTLTGGPSAAWTRLSASGTAPTGTVWVQMGIVLTGTSPSSAWAFQSDGLQIEANASPSAFCVTPQIKSVAPSVPGYSSVQITLGSNLLNSHAVGDTVCDPLPPGSTSPPTSIPRLSY